MDKIELRIDYYKEILFKRRSNFHRPEKVESTRKRISRKKMKQSFQKDLRDQGII